MPSTILYWHDLYTLETQYVLSGGGGAKVVKSILKRGGRNKREQGAKGVKSAIKSMRTGEFCKRLINNEGILRRRGLKYEKL